jgi:hypothetical protein
MRRQNRNLAATHPHFADYAASNFRFEFFPYRPCNTPPHEKFVRTVAPRQCSPFLSASENQDARVLIFLCFHFASFRTCSIKHLFPTVRPDESFRRRIMKLLAAFLIFRFSFQVMNRSTHKERRTSCVLYDRASCRMPSPPTRLAGLSARAPDQKGGLPPLLDTPPVLRGGRA